MVSFTITRVCSLNFLWDMSLFLLAFLIALVYLEVFDLYPIYKKSSLFFQASYWLELAHILYCHCNNSWHCFVLLTICDCLCRRFLKHCLEWNWVILNFTLLSFYSFEIMEDLDNIHNPTINLIILGYYIVII